MATKSQTQRVRWHRVRTHLREREAGVSDQGVQKDTQGSKHGAWLDVLKEPSALSMTSNKPLFSEILSARVCLFRMGETLPSLVKEWSRGRSLRWIMGCGQNKEI